MVAESLDNSNHKFSLPRGRIAPEGQDNDSKF